MHDIAETRNPLWTRARAMFARAVDAIRLGQGFGEKIGDAASCFVAQLASLKLMPPALRRDILAWLAPLEHVVRKLLLAEAAEIHRAERKAAARVRMEIVPLRGMAQTICSPVYGGAATRSVTEAGGKTGSRSSLPASRSGLDRTRPETWRVQFSLALPRDPHRVAAAHAPRIRALWGATAPCRPAASHNDASGTRVISAEDTPFRLARRFEALRRVLVNPRPHAERLARALARDVRRFSQAAQRYLFAPCRTNDFDPADPRLSLDATSAACVAPAAFSDSS